VIPDRPALGFDGVLVALSRDNMDRNAALVQGHNGPTGSQFDASLRLSTTDAGGGPALQSPTGLVRPRLTHVVFTRAASGAERLYVDGVLRSSRQRAGGLDTWNPDAPLTLGDERSEERPWEGLFRRVAVYARALGHPEVLRNFSLGGAP
jgi:hypothetical protein